MKFKLFLLFPIITMFYGCAYSVATKVEPAVNIYSSYDDKIPGSVILVMDNDVKSISQSVKASSYVCSAHNFPVNMGDSLALSIRKTTEQLFETVLEENSFPSEERMAATNSRGIIYVKLDRFSPRINFAMGFWSASANASADLVLDVTVKDAHNKKLMVTAISGSRTADGSGGGNCSGGANVLSEAISQTVRDAMERYAERLANSEKIRVAFSKPSESVPANVENVADQKEDAHIENAIDQKEHAAVKK